MFSFALSWVKLQPIIIPVYIGAGEKHHEIGSCLDNVKYPHWFFHRLLKISYQIRCAFASVNNAQVKFVRQVVWNLKNNRPGLSLSPFVSGNRFQLVLESLYNKSKVTLARQTPLPILTVLLGLFGFRYSRWLSECQRFDCKPFRKYQVNSPEYDLARNSQKSSRYHIKCF